MAMLFELHLFGISDNAYLQYPLDGTEDTFRQCARSTKKSGRLSILREGTLYRYVYTRNIKDDGHDRVIGIALSFNGICFSDINAAAQMFEKIFTHIVTDGFFLRINNDGKIIFNVDSFMDDTEELRKIHEYVAILLEAQTKKLISFKENFCGAALSSKDICLDQNNEAILALTEQFGRVNVLIEDENEVSYYAQIMSRLNEENRQLKESYNELLRQKKQFRNVILLILVIVCCGIGIYFLYSTLNVTQGKLDDANQNIVQQKSVINEQKSQITDKDIEITALKAANKAVRNKLTSLQAEFDTYKEKLAGYQPLLVLKSDYSFSTGYIKFSYYGLKDGNYTFAIRVVHPDGHVTNSSASLYVKKGQQEGRLYVNSRLNYNNYYNIEILYNGKTIGGGRY